MSKGNNFDAMRLLFALFVIITHSYDLTGVSEHDDPLYRFTNGSITFSALGLSGFFIISGYLISKSLIRSHSLGDYYRKRALRIYPGLVVALLITVLVGMFISRFTVLEYILNGEPFFYLLSNLVMIDPRFTIEGMFEKNPYPKAVNGSLWTIQYEFLFYILLSALFFFRQNRSFLIWVLITSFSLAFILHITCINTGLYLKFYSGYYVPYTAFNLQHLSQFGMYFTAGAILSVVAIDTFKYKNQLFFCAFILTIGTMAGGWFGTGVSFLLLPLLIVIGGNHAIKEIADINKKVRGDLSYGIYLYGFLIQQTIMHFYQLNVYELMAFSIPVAIFCGYLSWNLVEKNSLKLKEQHSKADAILKQTV